MAAVRLQVQGGPLLSPRLERTQPWSQYPTSGFRECPAFVPSPQTVPGAPGAGDEVREVGAVFKHTSGLHIQED